MKNKRKTMRAVLGWLAALVGVAAPVTGWVWFGYDPGRSEWKITPATITLAEPRTATQLHVREFMPDIGQYGGDLTAQSVFWTDNPEWSLTPGGVLSCRVSGPGVVHARLPDGRQLTQTIHVDPHLPPRILVPPVLPKLPEPQRQLVYIDTRHYLMGCAWDDLAIGARELLVLNGVTSHVMNVAAMYGTRQTNLALRLLAYALQGLVNRVQPRIITYGGTQAVGCVQDYWREWIEAHGFTITREVTLSGLPALLETYTNEAEIAGVLVYPPEVFTNAALADLLCWITAASAVSNVLPVTPALYGMLGEGARARWPVVEWIDLPWLAARGMTNSAAIYADAYTRWWPGCSHRTVAHMHPWILWENRDYWIAARIWPFCWRQDASAQESGLFSRLLKDELPVHAVMLGGPGQFGWAIDRYCGKFFWLTNQQKGAVVKVYLGDDWGQVTNHVRGRGMVAAEGLHALLMSDYSVTPPPGWAVCGEGFDFAQPLYFERFEQYDPNVEWAWWKRTSEAGISTTYTYVPNWSFYAGMRWEQMTNDLVAAVGGLRRPAQPASAVTGPYIYVCGWMADGDNTMFDTYTWPRYWRDPLSPSLPWSYGIALMMYDAAPLQMKWFHMHETAVRRIDAEAGVSEIWSAAYGSAYGQHQALLADYLRLSDEYLARSGLRMIRPQLRVGRAEYEAYSQMQHAEGLGGNYENTTGGWNIELRPTNMAGKVWLLHPNRLRLGEEWRQQFLIRTPAEREPRPQYHSVWCCNAFTPSNWAQWVDVQTNVPAWPDPNAWRRDTSLEVVPPEILLEMLK